MGNAKQPESVSPSMSGGRLMKAMYINAPGQVEFRDIDKPVRQKGEVLLKLLYGGICGSDLGSYKGTFAYFDICGAFV